MRKKKTVAQLRAMICTAGYYRKRKRLFKKKQAVCERLVASARRYSDEALKNMLRYQRKAEWYRKRESFEPIMPAPEKTIELELMEYRFRMLARDLRDLMGCEHCEQDTKGTSLTLAARLVYRVFNCTVPEEWTKDE